MGCTAEAKYDRAKQSLHVVEDMYKIVARKSDFTYLGNNDIKCHGFR